MICFRYNYVICIQQLQATISSRELSVHNKLSAIIILIFIANVSCIFTVTTCLCYVMLCYDMLCCVMLCCVMVFYVMFMLCYTMLFYAILCLEKCFSVNFNSIHVA